MKANMEDSRTKGREASGAGLRRYRLALGLIAGGLILAAGLAYGIPAGERSKAQPAVPRAAPPEEARLLFVGDIMLDRYIRRMLEERGTEHVFGGVRELLASADFVAGNLEGPVTDRPSTSRHTNAGDPGNMRFTFAADTPDLLKELGFGLVSLGNNHILDQGPEGAAETERRLDAAGLPFIGYGSGLDREPVMKEANGIRIAFVSYNDFVHPDPGGTAERIRAASAQGADAIVVLAHWDEEYVAEPSERVRTLARGFADAGATLVIGTHSHVIGQVEERGAASIYYSLGNFAFDQYWEPQVRCGRAVLATFTRGPEGSVSITYEEHLIGMRPDGRSVIGCE